MPDDEGYDPNCAMVPISFLANEGGTPEPGDAVSFNVSGVVESIDGDDAKIRFQQIDGKDLPEGEPNDAQMQDKMGELAANYDSANNPG